MGNEIARCIDGVPIGQWCPECCCGHGCTHEPKKEPTTTREAPAPIPEERAKSLYPHNAVRQAAYLSGYRAALSQARSALVSGSDGQEKQPESKTAPAASDKAAAEAHASKHGGPDGSISAWEVEAFLAGIQHERGKAAPAEEELKQVHAAYDEPVPQPAKAEAPPRQDIVCPFCGDEGFDLPGLKLHISTYCDIYDLTECP